MLQGDPLQILESGPCAAFDDVASRFRCLMWLKGFKSDIYTVRSWNPHGHNSAWPSGVGNILTVQTSPGLKPTESPYLFDWFLKNRETPREDLVITSWFNRWMMHDDLNMFQLMQYLNKCLHNAILKPFLHLQHPIQSDWFIHHCLQIMRPTELLPAGLDLREAYQFSGRLFHSKSHECPQASKENHEVIQGLKTL